MTVDAPSAPGDFEAPPADFDPLMATAEELLAFNLPLRPDADHFPELHAFWERMFSPPLRFLPLVLKAPEGSQAQPSDNSRRQSSLNWSGAYIKPRDGKAFTEIHGRWRVPHVETSMSSAASDTDLPEGCSIWIGLDGQRRYYQSSLPQVGTLQTVPHNNGQTTEPAHYAWFQWWDRRENMGEHSDPPWRIEGFPVKPDDIILCSLFKTGPSQVKFIMKNEMTGDTVVSFDISAPVRPKPLVVSGATAQWIVERPSKWPDPEERFTFPDYGTVQFDDCIAVMMEPGGGAREQRNLHGARLISMRETRQNPPTARKISTAHSPETHRFQTTAYQASKQ